MASAQPGTPTPRPASPAGECCRRAPAGKTREQACTRTDRRGGLVETAGEGRRGEQVTGANELRRQPGSRGMEGPK